jgi:hypothetical protein
MIFDERDLVMEVVFFESRGQWKGLLKDLEGLKGCLQGGFKG